MIRIGVNEMIGDQERNPKYFPSPVPFRRWLERHHHSSRELWVGFYKKSTGLPSITWPEAVDQLFCFGWIDGVRKSVDDRSYTIRVTPRKTRSLWSSINTSRAKELVRLGLMQPAGLKALSARDRDKTRMYSFEREHVSLTQSQQRQFRAASAAWKFFHAQPPWYRKTATWWVVSAKQQVTRDRRLLTLITDSEAGRRIAPMRPGKKKA